MNQVLTLLLLIGLFGVSDGCIRKNPEQGPLKCGVQEQATCGDLGSVGPTPQFKAFCASCHQFDKSATGTPLRGMMKRVPNREWLLSYLQNEESLIRSGDTTAIRISRLLPAGPCHKFSNLTDDHWVKSFVTPNNKPKNAARPHELRSCLSSALLHYSMKHR